jgi:hypothetical protein
MASMTGKGQSGDLLLRVTLSVPLTYAAFESAYWLSRRGLHGLTLGGHSLAVSYWNVLLVAPVVLFGGGAGLLLSRRGGRATWSIVLACSLAFSAIWVAFLWSLFTSLRPITVPTGELGAYLVPAVYLALISMWSLRQGTQPRF